MGSGRAITLMQHEEVLLPMTQTISSAEIIIICTSVLSFIRSSGTFIAVLGNWQLVKEGPEKAQCTLCAGKAAEHPAVVDRCAPPGRSPP